MSIRYQQEILTDLPSLYLRLGESSGTSAVDISGNALNGVYQNSPTLGVVGALTGDLDTAVTFNGSTQYVDVADNPLLDPGDVFTLEAWINPVAGVVTYSIVDKGVLGYVLVLASNPVNLSLILQKSSTSTIAISTAFVPTGVWSHVVATKNGSDVHLYINGVDVTGVVTNATIVATAISLKVGQQGGSNYFNGSIDEVAIYSTALSAIRVAAHYNAGTTTRHDTDEYIALVEIDWDSGTEYYSYTSVRGVSTEYLPYVVSISEIRRSVSVFGGDVSIGDVTIELANSPEGQDRVFSVKLASAGIHGRTVRVKYVDLDSGLASAITLFTGTITDWSLKNSVLTITGRPSNFDRLFNADIRQTMPMTTKAFFPDILSSQIPALVPLIFGRVADAYSTLGGATRGYLISTVASPDPFVYVLMARPCGTLAGAGTTYVYGLSPTAYTAATLTINGITYTIVTFATEQRDAARPNEIEITAYISGVTEDDSTSSTPILNPVRALEYFLETYGGFTSGDFDTAVQTTAKALAVSLGYADEIVVTSPNAAASLGAIISDDDKTVRDVVSKFSESFCMQLYVTREGKLATFILTDSQDPTPDFTVDDETDILAGTFSVGSSTEPDTSVIQYNYHYRDAFGRSGDPAVTTFFEQQPDYVIPGEKTRIGGTDVRVSRNLWYCRKPLAAVRVARAYASLLRSQTTVLEFELPIHFFDQVDLNKHVGVTHWQGISASGGFANVTARITDIGFTVEPRNVRISLKCIKRVTRNGSRDDFTRADSNSLGSDWSESESVATALIIKSNRMRFGASTGRGIAFHTSVTLGNNQWVRIQPVTFVASNARAGVFVRGSGTYNNFTGYALTYDSSNGLRIIRYSAADISTAGTVLATYTTTTVAAGDEIELRVEGTTLDAFVYSVDSGRNGHKIGPITDANIASGQTGLFGRNVSTSCDIESYEDSDF